MSQAYSLNSHLVGMKRAHLFESPTPPKIDGLSLLTERGSRTVFKNRIE